MLAHLQLGTITPDDIPPHWLPYILAFHQGREAWIAKQKQDPTGGGGKTGEMATPDRKRQILQEIMERQGKQQEAKGK